MTIRMIKATVVAGFLLLVPSVALAGHHRWHISEVFSDVTGTVQFIELFSENTGEAGLGPFSLTSASGGAFQFVTNLPGDTADTWVLVATTGFAALPGAPTPDYTLPDDFIDPTGDTVIYAGGADMLAFESLPTNGVDSIDGMLTVGTNSPTNFAGDTGSVNANSVPSLSRGGLVALAILLFAGMLVWKRRSASAS